MTINEARNRNNVRRISRRIGATAASAALLLGLAAAPAAADTACDRSFGISCGKVSNSRYSAGPLYVHDGIRTGTWVRPGHGSRYPSYIRDVAYVIVPHGFFAKALINGRWHHWKSGYHFIPNNRSTWQVRTFVVR